MYHLILSAAVGIGPGISSKLDWYNAVNNDNPNAPTGVK
jgi:hypothetical protein